jgi:hypothetical protein
VLFIWLTVAMAQAPAPRACESIANYQVLAAWVGEWTVTNAAGARAGASRVERSPDGCGLIEHWEGTSPAGQALPGTGLHAFDRQSQGWRHLWVDASGFTAALVGTATAGSAVYERASTQPGGSNAATA